jgi:hypothetical protein
MQASAPSSEPPPSPFHGASTTSTPRKPRSRPAIFSGVGGSSGSNPIENSSVISGVSALKMPASSDDTSVSPNAKSANGAAFMSAPRTTRCGHSERSRGSRSFVAARISSSAGAPNAQRRNATWTGAIPASSSTLMNMKLAPQMRATSSSWTGQRTPAG